VTGTLTVPVRSGPAFATGGWFGCVVLVDDVVLLDVDEVVGMVLEVDVEVDEEVLVDVDDDVLLDVDEEVLLEVLVDELEEVVVVVFFPPPWRVVLVVELVGPPVVDVLVDVEVLVDVDDVVLDDVDEVVGWLVEVDVELEVELLVDDEVLLDVVDEVDVVVGLAASAGSAIARATSTLPRNFPPEWLILGMHLLPRALAGCAAAGSEQGLCRAGRCRSLESPLHPMIPPPPLPQAFLARSVIAGLPFDALSVNAPGAPAGEKNLGGALERRHGVRRYDIVQSCVSAGPFGTGVCPCRCRARTQRWRVRASLDRSRVDA
jgi:hypothetical protein